MQAVPADLCQKSPASEGQGAGPSLVTITPPPKQKLDPQAQLHQQPHAFTPVGCFMCWGGVSGLTTLVHLKLNLSFAGAIPADASALVQGSQHRQARS